MLLRCRALALLNANQNCLPKAAKRFSGYIPVLISFAQWTRLTQIKGSVVSLQDAVVHAYGSQIDPTKLTHLLTQAERERKLLLLIDGPDEYADEQAAHTTFLEIRTLVTHAASLRF